MVLGSDFTQTSVKSSALILSTAMICIAFAVTIQYFNKS